MNMLGYKKQFMPQLSVDHCHLPVSTLPTGAKLMASSQGKGGSNQRENLNKPLQPSRSLTNQLSTGGVSGQRLNNFKLPRIESNVYNINFRDFESTNPCLASSSGRDLSPLQVRQGKGENTQILFNNLKNKIQYKPLFERVLIYIKLLLIYNKTLNQVPELTNQHITPGQKAPLPSDLLSITGKGQGVGKSQGGVFGEQLRLNNNELLDLYKNKSSKYINLLSLFDTELNKNRNIFYQFKNQNFDYNNSIYLLYPILDYTFKSIRSGFESSFSGSKGGCFISKPFIEQTPGKLIIKLFYYGRSLSNNSRFDNRYPNTTSQPLSPCLPLPTQPVDLLYPGRVQDKSIKNNNLSFLVNNLNKIFKSVQTPIFIELTRLMYPFYNSNILANVLGTIGKNGNYSLHRINVKLFKLAKIKNPTRLKSKNRFSVSRHYVYINPHGITNDKLIFAFLSGINIKVGGRLMRESFRPRKTVTVLEKGSLANKKANVVDTARYFNKNKRGAFSISVSTGHAYL